MLIRLFRTLAPLRWEQIVYRPLRVAQYRAYRYFPWLAAGEARGGAAFSGSRIELFRGVIRESFAHLMPPMEEVAPVLADVAANRFTFLNRTIELVDVDWNRRYEGHLWNYQLHYFGFALPCARAGGEHWRRCRARIESWIEGARPGRSDGWDAYPISLRVVNWLYAYALIEGAEPDRAFLDRWRGSLHRQLAFLRRHLEFHLLANHLLKNVKALVVGGLAFDEREWLETGERLLWREFDEQVLADGGHYERSPMYHAQTLADLLECAALLRAFGRPVPPRVQVGLPRMAAFLAALTHADGSLALFNDSANTPDTRPRPILEAARRICCALEPTTDQQPTTQFPQTGYYVWASPDGAEKIIVDAGPPSVAYNTAHAHCDLLSYELWMAGAPFIVDAGLHGYGGDPYREYCRSTRAHNTVVFDGVEQSEVWGTFRMARRAELLDADWRVHDGALAFRGRYRRYDRNLVHERRIHRTVDGVWTVADCAREGDARDAVSFLHLHPSVSARKINAGLIECRIRACIVFIEPFADDGGEIDIELMTGSSEPVQGWYFPEFGVARPSPTICLHFRGRARTGFGYRLVPRAAESSEQ
ncbi:MAG: alginate lyase family protein [Blastocatellia bacterium]|nr:alginate lyase family protein [Blastocatellia bacterium]